MTIKTIRKKITPILKREGVLRAAVFGSAAKGKMTKKSDIDILVHLAKNKNLLDLVGIKLALEDNLKRKVDVISYGGLHPLLKERILGEQKVIYDYRKKS